MKTDKLMSKELSLFPLTLTYLKGIINQNKGYICMRGHIRLVSEYINIS